MMKSLFAALVLLPSCALAQAASAPVRVSLDARGDDVREVIATLFAQAHKPYALDASIKGKLYVALNGMPFDKALGIVLTQAALTAKIKDGVTLIVPAPKPVELKPAPVPVVVPVALGAEKKAAQAAVPAKLTFASLNASRVTTRLTRAPLADVFAAFGEQARVTIELDPSVPPYKIDAYFLRTSLRYALDRVCKAAGLEYEIEGERIVVRKAVG